MSERKNEKKSEKKRIFVVDDEIHIRSMIRMFLENEGFQVETFANGYQLTDALRKQTPDMIILDIMMPGTDGLRLCTEIRKEFNIPIIFVSAKSASDDRIAGLERGGDDYLVKPFVPLELLVRVNALFRRTEFSQQSREIEDDKGILSCGNMKIIPPGRQILIGEKALFVTPNEFDILLYLCRRKETAVAKRELLSHVRAYSEGTEDSQILDDLMKRLRKKLQNSGASFRIATVWGYGYRMTEQERV